MDLKAHIVQAHPPATARSVSSDAASLRKENGTPAAPTEDWPSLPRAAPDQGSLPTAPVAKQPSLPRAAPDQGSLPTALIEKQTSLPKAAQEQGSPPAGLQKQGSTPAGLQQQQQQQQQSSVHESEGACTWSPPPDQEPVPFVSSTMALFNHPVPSGSSQADAFSQESAKSDG